MIALDILAQVRTDFEYYAKTLTKDDPEFQRFILDHERKSLVINQMAREIYLLEQKFGKQHVMNERRKIVAGVTEMFVNAARAHKDQQNMSEIARTHVSSQQRAMEEMQEAIKEVPSVG